MVLDFPNQVFVEKVKRCSLHYNGYIWNFRIIIVGYGRPSVVVFFFFIALHILLILLAKAGHMVLVDFYWWIVCFKTQITATLGNLVRDWTKLGFALKLIGSSPNICWEFPDMGFLCCYEDQDGRETTIGSIKLEWSLCSPVTVFMIKTDIHILVVI